MKGLTEDCNYCPIINKHSSRILARIRGGDCKRFNPLKSRYNLSHNLWKEMNWAMVDLLADKMVA